MAVPAGKIFKLVENVEKNSIEASGVDPEREKIVKQEQNCP
jgi:hypothetical protein